jgi:DNA-binding NarL/FixJ family response regulator
VGGKNNTVDLIAFPESHDAVPTGRLPSRALLLGEVLFHREALARALHAFADIALIGSVADVHAAIVLAEERSPDVLIVDSPSDAVARTLAAHPLDCKIVFIGAVGEYCRQLESHGAAIFVGASSSLDEVHVALRCRPRQVAPSLPDSILTSREHEVSRLIAGGNSNKEIADACGISIATVKNHVHHILGKLNFKRRTQIARVAGDPPLTTPRERGTD